MTAPSHNVLPFGTARRIAPAPSAIAGSARSAALGDSGPGASHPYAEDDVLTRGLAAIDRRESELYWNGFLSGLAVATMIVSFIAMLSISAGQ